ncbi:hypothetical protein DFQ26_008696 [Actinomortierella ambigua]|nr:hypothetical protein DFQ26_008696 [Actinomortierella ambigua]
MNDDYPPPPLTDAHEPPVPSTPVTGSQQPTSHHPASPPGMVPLVMSSTWTSANNAQPNAQDMQARHQDQHSSSGGAGVYYPGNHGGDHSSSPHATSSSQQGQDREYPRPPSQASGAYYDQQQSLYSGFDQQHPQQPPHQQQQQQVQTPDAQQQQPMWMTMSNAGQYPSPSQQQQHPFPMGTPQDSQVRHAGHPITPTTPTHQTATAMMDGNAHYVGMPDGLDRNRVHTGRPNAAMRNMSDYGEHADSAFMAGQGPTLPSQPHGIQTLPLLSPATAGIGQHGQSPYETPFGTPYQGHPAQHAYSAQQAPPQQHSHTHPSHHQADQGPHGQVMTPLALLNQGSATGMRSDRMHPGDSFTSPTLSSSPVHGSPMAPMGIPLQGPSIMGSLGDYHRMSTGGLPGNNNGNNNNFGSAGPDRSPRRHRHSTNSMPSRARNSSETSLSSTTSSSAPGSFLPSFPGSLGAPTGAVGFAIPEEGSDASSSQPSSSQSPSLSYKDKDGKDSMNSIPRKAMAARIFECSFEGCNKAYTQLHNLKSHERTGHAPVAKYRPFLCIIEGCTKAFSQRKSLAMHIKTAHEDFKFKPFKCTQPGCEKAYTQLHNLRTHEKSVHHLDLSRKRIKHPPSAASAVATNSSLNVTAGVNSVMTTTLGPQPPSLAALQGGPAGLGLSHGGPSPMAFDPSMMDRSGGYRDLAQDPHSHHPDAQFSFHPSQAQQAQAYAPQHSYPSQPGQPADSHFDSHRHRHHHGQPHPNTSNGNGAFGLW